MSRSALLIVTESRSGKANSHSISPLTTPRMAGWPRGGAIWKWALRIAAKFVWRRHARKKVLRDPWRHADNHRIVRAKRLRRAVKVERNGALALETDRPQALAEANHGAARGENGERRIDEAASEPMASEERVAGLSPRGESLAQQSRGKRGGAFPRISVKR